MNIDDILEMMDEILDKAPTVPFSGKKVVVESETLRDLINDVRLNLPQEIKQAKLIVKDRQIIISDAQKEADGIVRKAEERSKSIVANDEIVKQAKQKAAEILTQAQSKAKEIRNATNDYIERTLSQTEDLLAAELTDVKRTRQAIRMNNKTPGNM